MELYGTGYVIDHCISRFSQERDRKIALYYITDALMVITDTLHGAYGGSHLTKRLADILEPQAEERETRSADEIINHMKEKIKALEGDSNGNESI